MKGGRTLLLIGLGCLASAGPAAAYTHWNDIRASALLPGDVVTLRTESAHGPGVSNTLLFRHEGIVEAPLSPVDDGPSTLEATVPGPVGERRPYGFRLLANGTLDLLAVQLAENASPAPADLTRLAEDPVGDESFGRPHLDLVECRVGRDGQRLYAALRNAGGGFPVSQGLTFFSYLLGIKEPGAGDPDTLFALIQTVTASGIIEPGLYQINGEGLSDLVKIGEITATEFPGDNCLLLSCQLADLTANPVFQSWFDPGDPRIEVAGFSQKITLFGGAQEADRTPGGIWHLREVALDPGPNHAPELADLTLPEPGAGGFVTVVYSDADAHCPVISELVFDEAEVYPLRPQSLDYGAPVVYGSDSDLPPLVSGGWTRVVARFSDDLVHVVELAATIAGVTGAEEGRTVGAVPNPFRDRVELAFSLAREGRVQLAIFDASGRLIAAPVETALPPGRHVRRWDGRDGAGRSQPPGVYFCRLRAAGLERVDRLTLLR